MSNLKKNFSKIYEEYIDRIYRFIYLKVDSEETAKDICAQTFLKAWEFYRQNPNIESFSGFLYKIARNTIIDYYRKDKKINIVSPEEVKPSLLSQDSGIEQKAILNSDLERIKKAISFLKEDYQNVIIWHYLDEMEISEISKIMQKSEQSVRVLLHRALKSLREKLEEI